MNRFQIDFTKRFIIHNLPKSASRVYDALLTAHKKGKDYAVTTTANFLGCSRSTVNQAIRRLVEYGFIERDSSGRHVAHTEFRPLNKVDLNMLPEESRQKVLQAYSRLPTVQFNAHYKKTSFIKKSYSNCKPKSELGLFKRLKAKKYEQYKKANEIKDQVAKLVLSNQNIKELEIGLPEIWNIASKTTLDASQIAEALLSYSSDVKTAPEAFKHVKSHRAYIVKILRTGQTYNSSFKDISLAKLKAKQEDDLKRSQNLKDLVENENQTKDFFSSLVNSWPEEEKARPPRPGKFILDCF